MKTGIALHRSTPGANGCRWEVRPYLGKKGYCIFDTQNNNLKSLRICYRNMEDAELAASRMNFNVNYFNVYDMARKLNTNVTIVNQDLKQIEPVIQTLSNLVAETINRSVKMNGIVIKYLRQFALETLIERLQKSV